jgi:3-oxoacyl-[acyl-carrier-protein] synthase-3
MLSILHSAYYLPQQKVHIEEHPEYFGISLAQAKIYHRLYGLAEAHLTGDEAIQACMAEALRKCLAAAKIAPEAIAYLVHTHTTELLEPFPNHMLATLCAEFGLTRAVAFGMHMNKCCSVLSGLDVLSQMLKEGEYALLLSGEAAFSKTFRYVPNTTLIGDAYTSTLVGKTGDGPSIKTILVDIEGRFVEGIWMAEERARQFEQEYFSLLEKVMRDTAAQAGLSLEQIALIIPHNVSLRTWKHVSLSMQIPMEKIFTDNIKKYAHCFGSDLMLNYADLVQAGRLQKGDQVMLVSVGIGAVFGAMVLTC